MQRRIVIAGGVGGGATVAAQIRRQDKEASIILLEKDNEIAFSNCGMPYYIGEVIDDREKLLVSSEGFSEKYQVDVRLQSEAVGIQREDKRVQVCDTSGVYSEAYDKLILAPGASPNRPAIAGMQSENTFILRTIPDMDEIKAYIQKEKPKSAVIVGAGFVGLEMAENLHAAGLECTLIDRSKQVMKLVDADMAELIQDHMKQKGVTIRLKDGLASFSDQGKTLHLNSGGTIQADMTILAAGIKPNTAIAKEAGLDLGIKDTIKVNDYMQTNDADIYALGDAVQTNDFLSGEARHTALAGPAHRQAYIIARHFSGSHVQYRGTIGASILKAFDLTVAASGNNESALKRIGWNYEKTTLNAREHAGYYPDARKLTLKILFDPNTGLIYSGQAIGFGGADKRHAVLATAVKGHMTIYDLADLELAYAPPYSSPKDPINILGYKAIAQVEAD